MKRVALLVTLLAVSSPAAASGAAPALVGAIDLAGGDPASLGVHEGTNKVFVSDDNSGDVKVYDGATLQQIGTASGVGGSGYETVVDESLGRVYVASHHHPFTTGYNDGTGKIAVIDAATYAVTQVDVPGQNVSTSSFNLVTDQVRDRVYVSHSGGFGYIDASNTFHAVAGAPIPYDSYDIGINSATNEVYYATGDNRLAIVNGGTLGITYFDWGPTGAHAPLDFAVNEQENKVYVSMVYVPGQAEPGIFILDRDTGAYKFVGRSDLNPLVFNPATNRLFAGVQVGTAAGIVEGATDAFSEVTLPDGGVGAMEVRGSSDNAFMSTQRATYVVNGTSKCFQRFDSGAPLRGGVVAAGVAVNQSTGRAYVVNDQEQAKVNVFEDGDVQCSTPSTGGGGGGGGGGTQPPAPGTTPTLQSAPDFTPPTLLVLALPVQRLTVRGLAVTVGCSNEPCAVAVRASVSVPRLARLYRFNTVRAALRTGERRVLRLRLSRKSLAAVRRALAQGRRLVAKAGVEAEDNTGNLAQATRKIRLRR